MRIIEATELESVRRGRIPTHVGCIMDGNGRWALARGLDRTGGHAAAEFAVVSAVDAALDLGVQWLTVYAFSTENWKREEDEIDFLMSFDEWLLREERRAEFNEKGVRIKFLGRISDARIPQKSLDWIDETMEMTKNNTRLNFCIAFNYGGRAELVDAVSKLVSAGVDPASITEDSFSRHLYDPEMPDMDLVIRTSAENRLSNFFLWHAAYAEFVFVETLWPDFRGWHLYSAVREYQSRMRRKGKTISYDD